MLYLDYSRKAGEWVPNKFGGREDLDAVSFLKEMNETLYGARAGRRSPRPRSRPRGPASRGRRTRAGSASASSGTWAGCTTRSRYFQKDPVYRRFHHHTLTFSLMYAFSENFVLPLSHDEVVHGKRSLLDKMPGDRWQKFANLRALYAYMWAHPGKKLLFMGGELGEWEEWNARAARSTGTCSSTPSTRASRRSSATSTAPTAPTPALWELDFDPAGFRWLEANDAANNVARVRARSATGDAPPLVCVLNLSPVPRDDYRVGMPACCRWREVLNTDSAFYGG